MLTLTRDNQALSPVETALRGFLHSPLFTSDLAPSAWNPPVDVVAEEGSYRFRFDLPGVSKDDIEINVESDVLSVQGERKDTVTETDSANVWRRESFVGTFKRAFQLPADADSAKVEASFDNGVLDLRVPKLEAAQPRKIEIAG